MGAPRAAQALAPRAGQSRGHAGFRGVPERYLAGAACPEPAEGTPKLRPEGRPYPCSRQGVIHETSRLKEVRHACQTHTPIRRQAVRLRVHGRRGLSSRDLAVKQGGVGAMVKRSGL